MKVNILGTEYTIETVKVSECDYLRDNNLCGTCKYRERKILIADTSEEGYFVKTTEEAQRAYTNEIIRHEIIHAFLYESGLGENSHIYGNRGWATNEEMIDWFALQYPKMHKAFEEAGCL
jgi:hypothetical protein